MSRVKSGVTAHRRLFLLARADGYPVIRGQTDVQRRPLREKEVAALPTVFHPYQILIGDRIFRRVRPDGISDASETRTPFPLRLPEDRKPNLHALIPPTAPS